MNKRRILIVDDESCMRELLAQLLSEDYQILLARTGAEALEVAASKSPSLILLDVIMPGMNGIEVCKRLRSDPQTSSIPVLMLTALDETHLRTTAFEVGADDYLLKPFEVKELLARVQSKLRRLGESENLTQNVIKFGDLQIDFLQLKAEISGKRVDFGQIEFKILNCLINHHGKIVDREVLNGYVWGDEAPADRALDPHITALRKKIRASRSELKTIYGRGYSLVLREQSS